MMPDKSENGVSCEKLLNAVIWLFHSVVVLSETLVEGSNQSVEVAEREDRKPGFNLPFEFLFPNQQIKLIRIYHRCTGLLRVSIRSPE